MKQMGFSGFPETCFSFLTALKNNNKREWFQKYQSDYINCVIKPTKQFVLAIGEKLKGLSKGIICDPRANALGSILRIYKGGLYEKAKDPYHTSIRLYFWEGDNKKRFQNPGYFLQFGPEGGEIYAGINKFGKVLISAYRNAILDEKLGPEIADAMALILNKDNYSIASGSLKQIPIELHKNHPRKKFLLYKGIWVKSPELSIDELYKKELVDICYQYCRAMYPIHKWLATLTDSVATLYFKYR